MTGSKDAPRSQNDADQSIQAPLYAIALTVLVSSGCPGVFDVLYEGVSKCHAAPFVRYVMLPREAV